MASAGRILIMPKGDWNAETEYEMLDLVNHSGASWLAKKNVVGIEPSAENSEYWQNMFNITAETFGALSTEKGGTIKGNVSIHTEWATLALKDESGRIVFLEKNPTTGVLSIMSYLNVDNQNNLMLAPETTEVSETLYLRNVVDGKAKVYQIFGEHNLPLLKTHLAHKANGGTVAFTKNPEGNDYVIHTFNIENQNDIMFFANTISTDNVYVTGINILNYQPNSVEVRFALSQPSSRDITFMVAYIKSL